MPAMGWKRQVQVGLALWVLHTLQMWKLHAKCASFPTQLQYTLLTVQPATDHLHHSTDFVLPGADQLYCTTD